MRKMNKVPIRAQIPKNEIIDIRLNTKDLYGVLSTPKVRYEVMAIVEEEKVFTGDVVPVPRFMIYYLNKNELLVAISIMEDVRNYGECWMTYRNFAKRLKISITAFSNSLKNLRRLGIVKESAGRFRSRGVKLEVDYAALQHLNDLVEGENPDVFELIRKISRKTVIKNISKADILKAYNNNILPPDHDPAEEEEYD